MPTISTVAVLLLCPGDDSTIPVLGYSDKGQIDWQHMPENMRSWLNSYAETISALGMPALTGVQTRGVRQAVTLCSLQSGVI